jgi:hypothetical protein
MRLQMCAFQLTLRIVPSVPNRLHDELLELRQPAEVRQTGIVLRDKRVIDEAVRSKSSLTLRLWFWPGAVRTGFARQELRGAGGNGSSPPTLAASH